MPPSPTLDFERLDVYQLSLTLVRTTFALLPLLPRSERDLRDQWKRAVLSVPLNIAEGSGKRTQADRARFRAIARGSAMECGALIGVAVAAGFVSEEATKEVKTALVRIVAMLTRMIGKGVQRG